MPVRQDDAILPATRIVAALVLPVLLLAFASLYFFPDLSGERFAWQVRPDLTAAYIGSGYLGGANFFFRALVGKRWHTVAAGFPAVATFTVAMLLATLLHWDRFDLNHFPFQLWLGLYIITPILVPWVWLLNRRTDPGLPEPGDVVVPAVIRWGVRGLGLALTVIAVVSFVAPAWLILLWPWELTLLTARLLAGWGALIGVGNLFIAGDPRWSAWRVGVESIGLWHLLFLAAAFVDRQEFTNGSLINWYGLSVITILILMALLYAWMQTRRQNLSRPVP